jgi:PAB1-binding protein PBP1
MIIDYDENIHTTSIDKSHPDYKKHLAVAERKAREIERSALPIHMSQKNVPRTI